MPIFDSNTLEFISRSPEQTRRVGIRLGSLLQPGDIFCLAGDLGAGKTTLVQGIAQGWGSLDDVTSPTFVLVNVYRKPNGQQLYHLDTYRLQNALEAEDLDIDTMLDNGCLLIEWPERIESILPQYRLWITLDWTADERRRLVFSSTGPRYEALMASFRQKAFGG